MYAESNYSPTRANASPTYDIVQVPATANSTVLTVKIEITDNNSVIYPNTIHKEITVVLPPPEPRERKPKPIRKPVFQPPVREIAAPWQAKWRLTQQRPRDGLR